MTDKELHSRAEAKDEIQKILKRIVRDSVQAKVILEKWFPIKITGRNPSFLVRDRLSTLDDLASGLQHMVERFDED